MFAAEQIVGKVKAPQHIQTGSDDADRCECVMVHRVIIDVMTEPLDPIGRIDVRTDVRTVPAGAERERISGSKYLFGS